jgi:RNA recognition motif-containing protein
MSRRHQPYGKEEGKSNKIKNGYGPIKEKDRGRDRIGNQYERPSRTLFIRNVNYGVSEEILREMFEPYGEIKRFFNLIEKRGMAFVTYYDSRSAEKAKREVQGRKVEGRTIDIHYALPKDEESTDEDDKNTGTLFVSFRNLKNPLPPNNEIKDYFSKWGEIKEVRECKNSPNQKFVEFYDLRDCEKAYNDTQNAPFSGGTLDVKYAIVKGPKDKRDSGSNRTAPSNVPPQNLSQLLLNTPLVGVNPILPNNFMTPQGISPFVIPQNLNLPAFSNFLPPMNSTNSVSYLTPNSPLNTTTNLQQPTLPYNPTATSSQLQQLVSFFMQPQAPSNANQQYKP